MGSCFQSLEETRQYKSLWTKMRLWIAIVALLITLVQSQPIQEDIDNLAQIDPESLESLKQEIDYALMKYNFNRPASNDLWLIVRPTVDLISPLLEGSDNHVVRMSARG